MKTFALTVLFLFLLLATHPTTAAVFYADLNSTNPTPPYATLSTAATDIQSAIDAASVGDRVLVNDGNYQTGGRTIYGILTNRVVVDKAVTVQSLNGPSVTIIQGYQTPIDILGNESIRCVYLTNGATFIGFTVTNGATRGAGDADLEQSGGGIWCATNNVVVSNCIVTGNSAVHGGGVKGGALAGCLLSGNSAGDGGGANASTLNNCSLTRNSAGQGGGVYSCTLSSCSLSNNTAGDGGGAMACILDHCTLTQNSVGDAGGGASFSTLNYCLLKANEAYVAGGGAYASTVSYSTFTGNHANAGGGEGFCSANSCVFTANSGGYGAGTLGGTLNNCTITGNFGIGALDTDLRNCIIYYNSDANWYLDGEIHGDLNYCCTTPLPDFGAGNFTSEPQLASQSHLSAGSPCRGAGSIAYTNGTDIDHQSWLNPASVGCDEFYASPATGPLAVTVNADYTNVAAGFMVRLTGNVEGTCTASRWEFGDGTILSNRPYATHAWAAAGDFPAVLRAYNSDNPAGVTSTQIVHVSQGIYYVALNSATPTLPYDAWNKAATNIQEAVDAALIGGTVLVSNGLYNVGGRVVYDSLTNRLVIDKFVTVKSVNGPGTTIIEGYKVPGDTYGTNAVRCVYLTNNASLIGFTITNGSTWSGYDIDYEHLADGGGIWCETTNSYISNCVVTGNSAWDAGAGVARGTLDHCLLTGNSTPNAGGGALYSVLNDCVISNNFAQWGGGGVYGNPPWTFGPPALLNRCLVVSNYTYNNGGGVYGSTCTSCQFIGNSAIEIPDYYSTYGGAAEDALLVNCTLNNNDSTDYGGGADLSRLQGCLIINNSAGAEGGGLNNCQSVNCTILNNSAVTNGGGALNGTLDNCIVYYNVAPTNANFDSGTLNNCCAFPLPTDGTHSFTNAPLLIDLANGDFHLQSNSPCINSGNNAANSLTTDLAGNPRVAGGTVDVGCYEFQSPASKISYAWLSSYGLPLDGSVDFVDSDGDGMNNWQEWRAGTDPSNSGSALKLLSVTNAPGGLTITWQSVVGVSYHVERTPNLSAASTFSTIQGDIAGEPNTTSFTDSSATNSSAFFYRVGVQ